MWCGQRGGKGGRCDVVGVRWRGEGGVVVRCEAEKRRVTCCGGWWVGGEKEGIVVGWRGEGGNSGVMWWVVGCRVRGEEGQQ